ncbi:MAG: hypothetical protein R3F61_09765 [Myxococcota bacterium]
MAGRFRLGARIGVGPDQLSYEAWDEATSRWVQLFVQSGPTVLDGRLVHVGIAQREDVGCIGEWFVSVLDPGAGEPLPRLLGRLGPTMPLDLESLMILGLGVCEALSHTGRWGLFHGDLGTRSLHVTPQLDPVIVDFPAHPGSRLSASSVPFASPERLLGHEGDARSDVYSIAALLYALRAGQPPFGWSEHSAREGHFYTPVAAHPSIPPAIMDVLATAMEKPARLRYPDPGALACALSDAYEMVAGAWTDEEVTAGPGREPVREEVALEEADTVKTRQPVFLDDPGTSWEAFVQFEDPESSIDDLDLGSAISGDDDRTLELGPEMLDLLPSEVPTPREPVARAPLFGSAPKPLSHRAPPPTTGRRFQRPEPVRQAYVPPEPLQPAVFDLNAAFPEGADDLELGTHVGYAEVEGYADAVGYADPEWADTLPPAMGRKTDPFELLEDESLPMLLIGALCALVIGMAGGVSVIAFLLAQIKL